MAGRHGVAYVQDATLAGELLATDPKNLPKAAMAVYYDKKGRAFAWQVRFDTDRWEELREAAGVGLTPSASLWTGRAGSRGRCRARRRASS